MKPCRTVRALAGAFWCWDVSHGRTAGTESRSSGTLLVGRASLLAEQAEISNYERVWHLLNNLQSKGRRSLTSRGSYGNGDTHRNDIDLAL